MTPHERFKQARNSQPKRITAQQIAERLGVTHNAVRQMELGMSQKLLKRAIQEFAPEWHLTTDWFYTPTSAVNLPPTTQESRTNYNIKESIDLPLYVGALHGDPSQCQWILTDTPSTRPIRAAFLSGPAEEYFLLIVAGDNMAPRIRHGALLLARKISIAPPGAIVLAQPSDLPRSIIGVFTLSISATSELPSITLQDKVLAQIEMIHQPTISGPNIEFNDGNALLETKNHMLFQSN